MLEVLRVVDGLVLSLLIPLAILLILSGLDDLAVDIAWLVLRIVRGPNAGTVTPAPSDLSQLVEKPIAILVPAWHEHQVIARMVENNLATIDYSRFSFFIGAYPNDRLTIDAVRGLEARFQNVHLCQLPHDGPTSKADCLNWVYQSMALREEASGERFEVVVVHDSEDVIHPLSLKWIAWYAQSFDFVQIPVLALHTHPFELTHGVYCDEFAEFHSRDLPVRNAFGGFVPSAGVGTGYRRDLLDRLAAAGSNRLFEPSCLTEDYENGLRVNESGGRQVFVPIAKSPQTFVATREYFPRDWRGAVRQRTRWVTGIALQTWQRIGWKASRRHLYWLWRDRKGLVTNPLGFVTNVLFFYGLVTGLPWRVAASELSPSLGWLLMSTTLLMTGRVVVRMISTARVYGLRFAALVPARILFANCINAEATFRAIWRYTAARLRNRPLVWVKTEHQYPARAVLEHARRPLGEILVSSFGLPRPQLIRALEQKPVGVRLGEFLVKQGHTTEEVVYQALGLQQQTPLTDIDPETVERKVARSLPARLSIENRLVPFGVDTGQLLICGPEAPSDSVSEVLSRYVKLPVQFHLITPTRFQELKSRLLDAA